MLTLSLRPGEYVDIGDDVRFVFTGGTRNNIHVLIDAPREFRVERTEASPEMRTPVKKRRRRRKTKDDLEERIREIFEDV
jgi:carbon storage regulator